MSIKMRVFLANMLITPMVVADDYSEGRQLALQGQSGAMSAMSHINPSDYLNDFTSNPPESTLDTSRLKEEALKKAARDEAAKNIIASEQERQRVPTVIDLNSEEIVQAGVIIDGAEVEITGQNIPCTNGSCLPTKDDEGHDFSEGIAQLGSVAGTAEEVRAKQIGSNNPSLFTGVNYQCRTTVAHIGNCCGGHARFLNCRKEEKDLAVAIQDNRVAYVGTYCAHRKARICWEEKQSWCVFPSKLASIFQIQGRSQQLKINFGWANHKTNAPNCRGISPEELARIDVQSLDLSSITQDFEARKKFKTALQLETQGTQKVQQLEQEGRAHD